MNAVVEEAARREYVEGLPTYQRYDAMGLVRAAARLLARDGDIIIYRDAFRWHDDADDMVMANHYECQDLGYLAETFGYEVVHNFQHVAVVRWKQR